MSVYYSIIIPAYNEESFLPATLAHLKESMRLIEEQGELIVVDNNSSDRTAEIAVAFEATVVSEPVNQISRARNSGAKQASGKYLIFLDADTLLDHDLIRKALDALKNEACCGGGAKVLADTKLDGIAKFGLNTWNWLSRKRLLAAGCFVFCLKEGFEAIGGFSERVYANEEIWFSKSLRSWGKKRDLKFLIISELGVITSMRKLEWYSAKQMALLMISLVIFPPLVLFRRSCSHWYRR